MSRSYDAARSRARLLDAAHALFSERGYDATTTRQIAARADVDAALIGRYFGGKQQLYLAAVAVDGGPAATGDGPSAPGSATANAPATPIDLFNASPRQMAVSIASWMFHRTRDTGPGPALQALVRTDTTAEIRAAAVARIDTLLTAPLTEALGEAGVAAPRLRAEFMVFSLIGLVVGRSIAGSELDAVGHDELVELVTVALSPPAMVN